MTKSLGAAFLGSAFALAFSLCNADATTDYKVLHDFVSTDGSWPGAFVVDRAGNIIGTAEYGGANGAGTIFKLSPDGTFSVLHAFGGDDGRRPESLQYFQHSGRIVGSTVYGGRSACHHAGCGVLYSLKEDGTFTVLHSFRKNVAYPSGPVLSGSTGAYGTANGGGPLGLGYGTVWTLQGRHLTVLHGFNGSEDGSYPTDGLLKGQDGNFYGTTFSGGKNDSGVIYRITPDGAFTTLHDFAKKTDGSTPFGLVQDSAGNLYDSASKGGPGGGGTVFKMTPDGTFSVIHSFGDDVDEGGNTPGSTLLLIDNTLYGTTQLGGDLNCHCGVVFKLAMDGTETVLHAFKGSGAHDGAFGGELREGPHGLLYGAALKSGSQDQGILFQVKR